MVRLVLLLELLKPLKNWICTWTRADGVFDVLSSTVQPCVSCLRHATGEKAEHVNSIQPSQRHSAQRSRHASGMGRTGAAVGRSHSSMFSQSLSQDSFTSLGSVELQYSETDPTARVVLVVTCAHVQAYPGALA